MKEILELARQLTNARKKVDEAKMLRDTLEISLVEALKKSKLKAIKGEDIQVSLAKRQTLSVIDEEAVLTELRNQHQEKMYTTLKLNRQRFDIFAKQFYEQNRKPYAGMEMRETEYPSIRTVKKD